MDGTILLNANENTRQVEEEERSKFMRSVLETVGIPMEGIWDETGILTIENKNKLRTILASFNVIAIEDIEGGMKIYANREEIARWNKPSYVLKRDMSQIDRKKQLYLEMKCSYWSIFETQPSDE